MDDLRKKLLKCYRDVKTGVKSFERPLNLSTFLKHAEDYIEVNEDNLEAITIELINEHFGSYTEFVSEAEKQYYNKLPQEKRALLSERSKKFDGTATSEDCIEDLRRVQKDSPITVVSRNYYREHGKYSDSTWSKHFGTFLEFRRQAGLELTRQQHKLERDIAKHASVDHYRNFYTEQLAPFHKKYDKKSVHSKYKRIMVCSDLHDIDADEFTLEVFIKECKRKQPDIIPLNGDIYDLYELSGFTKDPRRIQILDRFNFVKERLFRPLREACPNSQIDLIAGNHEFRLIKLLADQTPNLKVILHDVMGLTCDKVFGLSEFEINWVSKFDLGAFTKEDAKREINKSFSVYYDCFAVTHEPNKDLKSTMSGTHGHHHKAGLETYTRHIATPKGVVKSVLSWTQTPAMCATDVDYVNHTPSWNTGFLEVVVNTETKEVFQKIHVFQKDWVEIDGIFYERNDPSRKPKDSSEEYPI